MRWSLSRERFGNGANATVVDAGFKKGMVQQLPSVHSTTCVERSSIQAKERGPGLAPRN